MAKATVTAMVLMLAASALADDARDLSFDEEHACRGERSNAAVYVAPPIDEVAEQTRVETQCRHLFSAKKSPKAIALCQRWRSEVTASIERNRADRKAALAQRDAGAKALAACLDAERRAHVERVAARKAEEDRKIAKAAAERERIEALLSSKPTVRLALSALVCVTKNDRAAALRAIADEKKYARIGGVQNLSKIYDLQQEIAAADQRKARFLGELKIQKASAIKCSDPKVSKIATCVGSERDDDSCRAEGIVGPVEAVFVIELTGLPSQRPTPDDDRLLPDQPDARRGLLNNLE